MKVFLGGTWNKSMWRDELIDKLKMDYFNPIVDNWTPECQKEEIRQRELCDYVLYTITPAMTGVYSIAEVIDDSNKRPQCTIFCLLSEHDGKTYTKNDEASLNAVYDMVERNGARAFRSLSDVASYLNGKEALLVTMSIKKSKTPRK